MRRVLPVLAVTAALVWANVGIGSALDRIHIRKVDSSGFPDVSVTIGLPRPDPNARFSIAENGRPARVLTVRSLEEASRSFDIVLVIDTSNSVRGRPLASGVAAARAFIQELPADVPVGIETFSDRARIVRPLTADHSAAVAAVSGLAQTREGTALYDAVVQASTMFSGTAEHNVVLVTDGQDKGSSASLDRALAAAKGAHVTLYCVGVGANANGQILSQLSQATHGLYASVDPEGLASLYRKIAGELASQYVVTYRSRTAPGAQVTVEVTADGATDRSIALMPRRPPSQIGSQPGQPVLSGTVGLVVTLALPFLATLVIAFMALSAIDRSRRSRRLAARVTPVEANQGVAPPRPDKGGTSWLPQPLVRVADSMVEGSGMQASLGRSLERAGVAMTAGELISAAAGLALVAGLGTLALFRIWWISLPMSIVAGVMPFLVVRWKRTKRIELLHEQLPDVLMILASSLRAGHSFIQSLDTVVTEVGDPSEQEFSRVLAEIRLGRQPDEALNAMAERVGTEEFKWAVLGVNVQHEVGGNLAEILDTLADTVRERHAIRRQVKTLSAEGRLSMKIIAALPPLLALYIVKVNPAYMRLLWTTRVGWVLMGVAVVLMGAGLFAARKIVRIDV